MTVSIINFVDFEGAVNVRIWNFYIFPDYEAIDFIKVGTARIQWNKTWKDRGVSETDIYRENVIKMFVDLLCFVVGSTLILNINDIDRINNSISLLENSFSDDDFCAEKIIKILINQNSA